MILYFFSAKSDDSYLNKQYNLQLWRPTAELGVKHTVV